MPSSTIFVLDDKPYFIELLRTILSEAGYRVRAITDGPSAIAELQRDLPDLVLLDVVLPGMSSLEVLRELRRARFAHIPVILISAHPLDPDLRYAHGVTAVFEKPCPIDELLRCIARHVSSPLPSILGGGASAVFDLGLSACQLAGPARLELVRDPSRPRQSPLSLQPLVHPAGLSVSLDTIRRIVAELDGAKPQQPSTTHEQWRYRFSWGEVRIVVAGSRGQVMLYGNDRRAMDRLSEVITVHSMAVLQAQWPAAARARAALLQLRTRYALAAGQWWPPQLPLSARSRYLRDVAAIYDAFRALSPDGRRLLAHTLIREGQLELVRWLCGLFNPSAEPPLNRSTA
jgi:CheY-like chemotaxis protein